MKDIVATVVATRRSAPRPVGSKLVVREDGSLEGSVSGGCVESDVVAAAQEVRESGVPRLVTYGITDDMALGVGLPCGGEIDVFVEPFRELPAEGVVLTVIAGEGVGETLADDALAAAALRRGRSHIIELDERTVFADVFARPPRLLVYGAVDTADALCAAVKILGWKSIVADARARFATPERMPNADELLVVWPEEAMEIVVPDAGTAIVVLTHDDKFDLPMLQAALASDAFYVGALGSRKNQARRNDLLREAGVSDEDIERIAGPSGLDIGADSPAETAFSMVAEMLAVRAGRSGGRLKEAKARIHAGPVA
ncbi:MAG TPA: XdhC family protein [Gaiellaceae bacterium]|nr:XdhC family protein [Gaiellaceae bacterium]